MVKIGGYWDVADTHFDRDIFDDAINSVAHALKFEDKDKYNRGCREDREEVKKRIKAL